MSHWIVWIVIVFVLVVPVALQVNGRLLRRDRAQFDQPPTDEELYEFHRVVNKKGGCPRARD